MSVFKGLTIQEEQPKAEFEIDSVERLDWYLKKRLGFHAEIEAAKIQYDKLISHLQSEINGLDFMHKNSAEYFVKSEYERTGRKTFIRPYGTCAIRKESPTWKLDDESKLQEWLGNLPPRLISHYGVTVKTWTRNLEAIKRDASTGVVVPGLIYDEGGEKISLRYPKEGDS